MHPISREFSNSQKQNQNHVINNSIHSQMHFDHNNEFLEQILSPSFPWSGNHLEDNSAPVVSSKISQHQMINNAGFMQQQQLLLSTGFGTGVLPDNHKHIIDGYSFKSTPNLQPNDASVKPLYNGFAGSMEQTSNQPHQFHNTKGGASTAMKPPIASGSNGGGMQQRPRQRVRARRGQATDPHSVAERLRRERIAERMKGLQELVPSANKTDKASMLDDIIDYVKFLRLQVKVLSMSRLGGAAAIAPLIPDISSEGSSANNGTQAPLSPNNNDGITVTEQHIMKLMEEDMGSAMQYLQGKGLCLMPLSLANAMCQTTRNPLGASSITNNDPLLDGDLRVCPFIPPQSDA